MGKGRESTWHLDSLLALSGKEAALPTLATGVGTKVLLG